MGCKDDDTCDQPVTKGDLEKMQPFISNTSIWIMVVALSVGIYFDSKNQRRVLSLNQAKLRHELKYENEQGTNTRATIIGDSFLHPEDWEKERLYRSD